MERLNLSVEDGIGDLMTELAGGSRQRGAWLSQIVKQMHQGKELVGDSGNMEILQAAMANIAGRMNELEGRVSELEKPQRS